MSRNIRVLGHEIYSFYFNKRIYSFFCVFLFLLYFYLKPVKDFSIRMNYPATPWGIVFLFSDVYFDVIFLAGAIYLFAKVPFMERQQMYGFIRLGKLKWIAIQILKMFFSSFLYVGTVFVSSILLMLPQLEWKADWGKLYYTLAVTDAYKQTDIRFGISYHIIKKYSPLTAMLVSYVVISLIVFWIGLVMLLISIWFSRMLSMIVASSFAIMPILIENLNVGPQQIFVKLMPTEWMKIQKIGYRTFNGVFSLDVEQIMIRMVVLILVLVIPIIALSNQISYDWYGED